MGGAAPTPTGKGGKKPLDAAINLVPFIDLLSCCISFLLITAVWTQLARMDVQQKGQSSAGATDEKPPDSGAFHSCRGPSLGHSFSKPVSREMPSRRGPRHRGQSSARAHGPGHAARNASAAKQARLLCKTGRTWLISCSGRPGRGGRCQFTQCSGAEQLQQ